MIFPLEGIAPSILGFTFFFFRRFQNLWSLERDSWRERKPSFRTTVRYLSFSREIARVAYRFTPALSRLWPF
jgi:hypothetical protein